MVEMRVIATFFSTAPGVARAGSCTAWAAAWKAAAHIGTVVGVADGGVKLGQLPLMGGDQLSSQADPLAYPLCVKNRAHLPASVHVSAAVLTGASHRRRTSSSARTSVSAQPAMSRLVT